MKTKHTQGEWQSRSEDSDLYIYSPMHGAIATIPKVIYGNNSEEHKANAKLIAAAPDLLEALIEMVEYNVDTHHSHVTKAKAAIKKATE